MVAVIGCVRLGMAAAVTVAEAALYILIAEQEILVGKEKATSESYFNTSSYILFLFTFLFHQ